MFNRYIDIHGLAMTRLFSPAILWLSLFSITIFHQTSHARLTVDKNIIDADAKSRRADVVIGNSGKQRVGVDIGVYHILAPGQEGERRYTLDNPRELGVLATPRQFELAPGEHRKVRISFLKPPAAEDTVYRIRVAPRELASSNAAAPGKLINISLSYDLLLIRRPLTPTSELSAWRDGRTLSVANLGNSNLLLFDGQQCDSQGENCKVLGAKRIYAGAEHRFELPYRNSPVRFIVDEGGNTYVQEF